jgi:hypothetical protein
VSLSLMQNVMMLRRRVLGERGKSKANCAVV